MSVKMVFSVFDSKAQVFLIPIFALTQAVAVRSFYAAVQQEGHDFRVYASDFTLFELGEFDDGTGEFRCHPTPKSVVLAATLVEMEASDAG